MSKGFNPPLFLKIENETQLSKLRMALQMQYEMEDDIALDDTITQVLQVREMAAWPDDEIRQDLVKRRRATNENIDGMVAIVGLQNNLQNIINNLPE